jgi:hypothetical protein
VLVRLDGATGQTRWSRAFGVPGATVAASAQLLGDAGPFA